MKVVTGEQMRAIEARSETRGISTDTLMENAGLTVARSVRRMLGPLTGVPILLLIGPGNNGGDGLVTARHLRRWGARATVYQCRERQGEDPKLEAAIAAGVEAVSVSNDAGLAKLSELLASSHLVIDAILGTGRARPIDGVFKEILGALSAARIADPRLGLLAMDLPTGLNCDTAEVDPACVPADITVSLGYPKRGHLGFPGAEYTGLLDVAAIGIPAGLDENVHLELMTDAWAQAMLPSRPADSHKGTYGRAMIVAGSRNFLGAAHLAATSATRVGAGLVTVAVPESLVAPIASKAIEPTFLPLPESSPRVVSSDAADHVLNALDGYSSLLVGCGLGQVQETRRMVENLLLSGRDLPPTVVDADGLNTLAQVPDWHERWLDTGVITPHPGEMVRLTGESTDLVRSQRIEVAQRAAVEWHKNVVLKGAFTVVADPDGTAMLSPFANPGLATAGTGDVLAGAIAGLMSQGLTPHGAAALGVYLHGAAGEFVLQEYGDTGMIASDLLASLPKVISALR